MKLPNMRYADRITKEKQVKFGGLNHTYGAGDGELWDMKNLTSDHYPLLATRMQRMKIHQLSASGGIYCREKLCWVDGRDFYYDGAKKGTLPTAGQKPLQLWAFTLSLPRTWPITTQRMAPSDSWQRYGPAAA